MKRLYEILLFILPTVQIFSMDHTEIKQEWQKQALYALEDMNVERFTLYFRALPTLEDTKSLFSKALMLRFNINDLGIGPVSLDTQQAGIINQQQVKQQQIAMDSFKTTLLTLGFSTYDFSNESTNQLPSSLMQNYLKMIAKKSLLKLRNQNIRCASDLFTQDELALFQCHNLFCDNRNLTDISNKETIKSILHLLSALEISNEKATSDVIKNFLQTGINNLLDQKQYPVQNEVCFSAFDKNTTDEEKDWYYQAINAMLKKRHFNFEEYLYKFRYSTNTAVKNRLILLAHKTKIPRLIELAEKLKEK